MNLAERLLIFTIMSIVFFLLVAAISIAIPIIILAVCIRAMIANYSSYD